MKQSDEMYEVWWSMGNGTHSGPRFSNLNDAIRYVSEHWGEATFAIKTGANRCHRWQDGSITIPRRSAA